MGQLAGSDIFRGSLWIRPTGPALETLQQAIRRVQDRCGGPGFMPHITLLGGINMRRDEAEDRMRQLAASFMPFTIRLGKLDWYNEHYRVFFAQVQASEELLAVRRRAEQLFALNPHDPFEPHVSLYYGELDDETRRAFAAEFGGAIDVSFQATSVELVTAAAGIPIEQWRLLAESEFRFSAGIIRHDAPAGESWQPRTSFS